MSDIEQLEKKMAENFPARPIEVADVAMAAEIRAHVARQERPIDSVLKTISDLRILGALIHAPAVLSGLSEEQLTLVRNRAGSPPSRASGPATKARVGARRA
jgi:hypothetical protein